MSGDDEVLVPGKSLAEREPSIDATYAKLLALLAEAQALGEEVSDDPGTALVALEGADPAVLKKRMAATRTAVMKKQMQIKAKQEELQALLQARLAEVNAVVAPLTTLVRRLEEGIWTANLYLGREEKILTLREGESASADEPLAVRQLVLAMDEECAVAAESGGIDAMSMEAFDKWLLADPAHLDQVLPEEKGVVALVPRWSERDYGNPWENVARNHDNHQTYFLLRNGERLYRYVTEFVAGARLIPNTTEFSDYFYERGWFGQERTPLEPGTSAWKKAEEMADARRRHYMRVGLILQGLVDRTTIFAPMATPVHFLEPDDYDAGLIRLVADGDLALEDGRESFRDWQRRLVGELRPGMRIVGAFRTYESRDDWALAPASASLPESFVPHTITERVGSRNLKFVYERRDTLYGYRPDPERPGYETWQSWTPRRKASCTFSTECRYVLPLDLISVEDVEYYLRSRTQRREYVNMFPLLKAARRILHEEERSEEPFRLLLTGLLAKDSNMASAAAAVGDLVEWYKTTNRHHRALVGSLEDNAKAVRLITAEYRARLKDARVPLNDMLVTRLREQHPDALVIARARAGTYVVLEPQDEGDTFVVESTYSPTGERRAREEWQLVGTRAARWVVAYASPQWAAWNTMAEPGRVFRGPELEAACDELRARVGAKGGRIVAVLVRDGTRGERRLGTHLTALVMANDVDELAEPWTNVLSERRADVKWRDVMVRLQRTADGVALVDTYSDYPTGIAWPTWEPTGYASAWWRIWLDEEAAEVATAWHERFTQWEREHREKERVLHGYESQLAAQLRARDETAAYATFLEEYGDPDLWEGHRKGLRFHPWDAGLRDFGDVDNALRGLIDRRVELEGRTLGDVVAQARDLFGCEDEVPEGWDDLVFRDKDEA